MRFYKIKIVLFVVAAMLFSRGTSSAGDGGVAVRETSLESAYKDLLEENRALNARHKTAMIKASRLSARVNYYSEKLKVFDNTLNTLKQDITREKNDRIAEAEEAHTRIKSLEEERNALLNMVTSMKEERVEKKYYQKWKDIKKELRQAANKMKKLLNERKKQEEETGKMHYNLAGLYFKDGDYKKATYEYEQALKNLPNDPDVYYNLAVLYDYYVKDAKKATDYYDAYLKKSANPKRALTVKERMHVNSLETKMNKVKVQVTP